LLPGFSPTSPAKGSRYCHTLALVGVPISNYSHINFPYTPLLVFSPKSNLQKVAGIVPHLKAEINSTAISNKPELIHYLKTSAGSYSGCW
jgi:hypothetical protein